MSTTKQIPGITFLGYTDSFMLFGKGGNMERNKRIKIERGVKIISFGFAGMLQYYVTYDDNGNAVEIYNGNTPEVVGGYELDGGYFGSFTHVEEDSTRPFSQKFGIGHYYDDSEQAAIISDEVIEKSLIHARAVEAARNAKEEAEKNAFKEAKEEQRRKYSGILQELPADYKERAKVLKRNISTIVKQAFPGLKFSIRKSWRGYEIAWTDGPTSDEMHAVADIFAESCERDPYNDDLWDYSDTPFTAVWGGVENIGTDRTITESLKNKAAQHFADYCTGKGWDQEFNSFAFMMQNEFNAYYSSFECYKERPEQWRDVIARELSDYTKPEQTTTKAVEQVAQPEGEFIIIDYSDKAVALVGDTKAIKEQLKALGGRFNPRLSCGAGWIFSKRKENELKALLTI